jgi:aspartyl-tRNA(Asn)/glutamyl-tRNA(Gln) amidotransferase subunit B
MKTIIGFEIHEQLATKTKLYCDSPTNYREVEPNTNVCEVCTGMPGAKPYPMNQDAIDAALEIALMLNCEIVKEPVYIQRKHYDYPDLPSGYQRTSLPIGVNGRLNGVGIWEVHLEEDPGKYDPLSGRVDYNRSGVPLVEIVTAPDIRSPEEARGFLRELTKVLQYTGKVRPEGGTMRMDTNISLEGGARVEIKNINSVKGAYRALKFEITRQKNLRKRGVNVKQETRAFLEAQMITRRMRTKETAEDYRYIPDPDIPPLLITEEKIREIKARMPEAPHLKLRRFMEQYGISRDDAWAITSEIEMADAFEEANKLYKDGREPQKVASYFRHQIKKVLTYNDLTFKESGLTGSNIAEVLDLTDSGEITASGAELTIRGIIEEGKPVLQIVEDRGLSKIKEDDVVKKAVKEAVAENPKAVEDYNGGKPEALNFILGQIMRKTKGRADPKTVRELLMKELE